ncbi:MAG: thioredoxin family protein [Candidatus Glassbacteria bacterium]|nr:thioredoxin family protein [Candidatus Glassbacteria bacterium]
MSKLKTGDTAIDFSLPGTEGGNYSLSSFKDSKALAVVFSCVHCPYVLAWEGRLIDLARKYRSAGFAMVLICANDPVKYPADNFENMAEHARKKLYPFPFLQDESQEVARAYGAERTPEIFLFDSGRRLVYHGAPDDNHEDPGAVRARYLKDAVEAVLAGKPVAVEQIPPVGCTIKWK